MSSYIDMTAATIGIPYEATYIYARGQWVNPTTDPTTGAITLGNPIPAPIRSVPSRIPPDRRRLVRGPDANEMEMS
jgi:hypothetical protein